MRKDQTVEAWVDSIESGLIHLRLADKNLAKTACYDAGKEIEMEIESIFASVLLAQRRLEHVLKYHNEGGRYEFVPAD